MSATGGLGERRYDLDWVRVAAFLLLILYHIGMYYVTWDWHVKSPHASSAIEPLMLLTSPWRLSLLFLVSGVATAYLLERQSVRGFLRRRSVRLLVPLVFGMLVIVPPQSYLEVVEKVQYAGNYGEFLGLYLTAYHGFCRDGDCLIMPTWNHLWFVAYLWVYTLLLYVAVRAAPGVVPRLRASLERRFVGLAVLWGPIVYLVAARWLLAVRFPSTHELVNDWYNHAVYAPVFLLGFALAGARAPWETIERLRWHALGFAVLGWVFLCVWHGLDNIDALPSSITLRRVWQSGSARRYGSRSWQCSGSRAGIESRQCGAPLSDDGRVPRLHPAPDRHSRRGTRAATRSARSAARGPPARAGHDDVVFLGYEVVRRISVLRPLFGLAVTADSEGLRAPVPAAPPELTLRA